MKLKSKRNELKKTKENYINGYFIVTKYGFFIFMKSLKQNFFQYFEKLKKKKNHE